MECLNPAKCLSDAYEDAPVIGSNPSPDSFHATSACGQTLLADGTMEECQAAITAHRQEVRDQHGEGDEGSRPA